MTAEHISWRPGSTRSIAGRVAIVTGAATGLGAAVAQQLSAAGAVVVLADVDRFLASALADTLDLHRKHTLVVTCDVTRSEDCQAVVRQTVERFGGIDIIVNCAGTSVARPLHALTDQEWHRALGTTLRGPFMLSDAALQALRAGFDGVGGHVVNVGSAGSAEGWASEEAYRAMKLGLLGLAHALHGELGRHGIRVSSVLDSGELLQLPANGGLFDHSGEPHDPGNVAREVLRALCAPDHRGQPEVMVSTSPRAAESIRSPSP